MSLGSGLWVSASVHTYIQELLETDVTLADDDNISILADICDMDSQAVQPAVLINCCSFVF